MATDKKKWPDELLDWRDQLARDAMIRLVDKLELREMNPRWVAATAIAIADAMVEQRLESHPD